MSQQLGLDQTEGSPFYGKFCETYFLYNLSFSRYQPKSANLSKFVEIVRIQTVILRQRLDLGYAFYSKFHEESFCLKLFFSKAPIFQDMSQNLKGGFNVPQKIFLYIWGKAVRILGGCFWSLVLHFVIQSHLSLQNVL